MLYDGCAGPEMAAGGCGSWWATGIMAWVNLKYTTFRLGALHVNWCDWIDRISNAILFPTLNSDLPPTLHCSPILLFFWCRFWSLVCWTTRGVKKNDQAVRGAKNTCFHLCKVVVLGGVLELVYGPAFSQPRIWSPFKSRGRGRTCSVIMLHSHSVGLMGVCQRLRLKAEAVVAAAAALLRGSQIPQARWGSDSWGSSLPQPPSSAHSQPLPSPHITHHSLSNPCTDRQSSGWGLTFGVHSAKPSDTGAVSQTTLAGNPWMCLDKRMRISAVQIAICHAVGDGGWSWGLGPRLSPQPCGFTTWPLDGASGLLYAAAVQCRGSGSGLISQWRRQIAETDFDNVKKEISFFSSSVYPGRLIRLLLWVLELQSGSISTALCLRRFT